MINRFSKMNEFNQIVFMEKNKNEKYYGKFKDLIRIVEKEKHI